MRIGGLTPGVSADGKTETSFYCWAEFPLVMRVKRNEAPSLAAPLWICQTTTTNTDSLQFARTLFNFIEAVNGADHMVMHR